MSVARNSHIINQPEANGALVLPPPPTITASFYGYLKVRKATRKGKKVKEGSEVTPGNQTREFPHRRLCTNQPTVLTLPPPVTFPSSHPTFSFYPKNLKSEGENPNKKNIVDLSKQQDSIHKQTMFSFVEGVV